MIDTGNDLELRVFKDQNGEIKMGYNIGVIKSQDELGELMDGKQDFLLKFLEANTSSDSNIEDVNLCIVKDKRLANSSELCVLIDCKLDENISNGSLHVTGFLHLVDRINTRFIQPESKTVH